MPIPDIDEACRRVLEAGGLQLAPADDPPGTFWLSGATFAIRELLKRLKAARPGLVIGNFARGLDERENAARRE